MDRATAKKLIFHAVEATRTVWSKYPKRWQDVDQVFIHHGYEQFGFEIFEFLPLLRKRACCRIDALGSLLTSQSSSSSLAEIVTTDFRPMQNKLYAVPFIAHNQTWDRIAINVTGTQSDRVFRLGVYTNHPTGRPWVLDRSSQGRARRWSGRPHR